ncbi:MAG: YkgJ family cysteine cluster protein [Desulfobacteraceae bacterium]|nr:YkgJ family cysteine cluster protein [Desulfobacteraceae bacterium]MBC2720655.1 YkgJ family cysteine cluster protein [Desulfobacteraceae bacterium]
MDIDFTPFFKQYEKVLTMVDKVFERVKNEHSECFKCKTKCSDCCNALFDLYLIEALYINDKFNKKFKNSEREQIVEKSNIADRTIYKLKRKAYKDFESGKDENELLTKMAEERVRCPLLNDDDMCDLYEHRPITCRLYGIPISIGGVSHTCGLSAFAEGKQYPTVNLEKIQNKLYEISVELVKDIKSRHIKLADVIIPLSMALLTIYDKEYLGVDDINRDNTKDKQKG